MTVFFKDEMVKLWHTNIPYIVQNYLFKNIFQNPIFLSPYFGSVQQVQSCGKSGFKAVFKTKII